MMPEIKVANSVEEEVLLAKANIITATAASAPSLQTLGPSMVLLGVGVLGFVLSAGGLVYWLRARKVG